MNCLIVDDNVLSRTLIKKMISQFDHLKIVGECEDAISALNFLKKESVDLMFLDVEMPKMSGLEFLKSLENKPLVILITAKKEYAVEAFEHNVVDYIVTPITEERFIKAINRAEKLFDLNAPKIENFDKDYIFVKDKGILTKILISEIQYLQALGDYVCIYTKTKKFTVRLNLQIAEEKLPSDKFCRIHRSYMVAIDQIDSVEENIVFIDKHPIPVGEVYKSDFLSKINLL